MNKLLATASFIALTTAATAAQADASKTWPKWYVGLSGGLTYIDDADISGTANGEASFDIGGNVHGSLGYVLPFGAHPLGNWRVEAEAGYFNNSLDGVTLGGAAVAGAGGDVRIASYMANLYYDFRSESRFTPYVGGGVGAAQVQFPSSSGAGNTADDDDTVFAYQAMVGLAYAPASLPNTEWSIGYRYFGANSLEYSTAGGKIELDDLMVHSAEIGARFKF